MTRQGFISALRRGLSGLPPSTVEELVADYETHFAEGAAAGRSEEDVAAALGDPARLARELRAEAGVQRWKEERNASSAAGMVLAVLGLATVDIFILLPVLITIGSLLFAAFMVSIAFMVAGAAGLGSAVVGHTPDAINPLAVLFGSLGLMSASVALGAVLIPIVVGLLDLLGRYGRLHFRLLEPALNTKQEEKPQ